MLSSWLASCEPQTEQQMEAPGSWDYLLAPSLSAGTWLELSNCVLIE